MSEQWRQDRETRSTKTEVRLQPCTCRGPTRHNIGKRMECNACWANQTGEAEKAIEPRWLAHTDVGPRVRGREMVQKNCSIPKPNKTRQRIPQTLKSALTTLMAHQKGKPSLCRPQKRRTGKKKKPFHPK